MEVDDLISELEKIVDDEDKVKESPKEEPKVEPKEIDSLKKEIADLRGALGVIKKDVFTRTPEGQIYEQLKSTIPSITPQAAAEISAAWMKVYGGEGGGGNPPEPPTSKVNEAVEGKVAKSFGIKVEDMRKAREVKEKCPEHHYTAINLDGTFEYAKEMEEM